ncbi:MAG: transcriptional coactivator p15/PC4 family protein [Candidatus Omnitrophica bacterium]|nr:transcriptional coactivator p15/PC4 family protein [Candidatus Omnitrophota bacterium]
MKDSHVYSFQRNENEELRITLREYKGTKYIDMRLFFSCAEDEEMRPTKKGITIPVSSLVELERGLKKVAELVTKEELNTGGQS